MNIKLAKQQIKNSVDAYLTKDPAGDYVLNTEKQRPLFLIGAPGIGKTAIMEQIAVELHINLVAYTMTHHTRQSALGLPFIREKVYDNRNYSVSEYTMSEIISSVYEKMDQTGIREGILFLDEINCISETLAPAMLQFLQYKVFGRHRLPDGWIVVSAGNPPEYNYSVREFDIATLDRLKKLTIEPDYGPWKEYAFEKGIHPAILTYLDMKKTNFYSIQEGAEGKSFVTARGWEDLSLMLGLYERKKLEVDEELIGQYLQHKQIAGDFTAYYELYVKYKSKYNPEQVLDGTYGDKMILLMEKVRFDERLTFIGIMIDAVNNRIRELRKRSGIIDSVYEILEHLKQDCEKKPAFFHESLDHFIGSETRQLEKGSSDNTMTKELKEEKKAVLANLNAYKDLEDFEAVSKDFTVQVSRMKEIIHEITENLNNLFEFMEQAFGRGQEMMILLTNLTVNPVFTWYVAKYGCRKYYKYNKELLLYERENNILEKIDSLEEERSRQLLS